MVGFDSKKFIKEFSNGYKLNKKGELNIINENAAINAKELFKKNIADISNVWIAEDHGTDGPETWGNDAPPETADQEPEQMDEKDSGEEFDFSFLDHGLQEDGDFGDSTDNSQVAGNFTPINTGPPIDNFNITPTPIAPITSPSAPIAPITAPPAMGTPGGAPIQFDRSDDGINPDPTPPGQIGMDNKNWVG